MQHARDLDEPSFDSCANDDYHNNTSDHRYHFNGIQHLNSEHNAISVYHHYGILHLLHHFNALQDHNINESHY